MTPRVLLRGLVKAQPGGSSGARGRFSFMGKMLARRPAQTSAASPPAPLLAGLDWLLAPGDRVGVVGLNGAGKTTLARLLVGLIPPDRGLLQLDGEALWQADGSPSRASRHGLQLVLQDPHAAVHPRLTVREALWETLSCHEHPGLLGAGGETLIGQSLAAAHLTHRADAFPAALSGGELRRLGVARALLTRPRLLVLDEPTANLDAIHARQLVRQLLENTPKETTVVWISHDLEVLRAAVSEVYFLEGGQWQEHLQVSQLRAARAESTAARRILEAWEGMAR